MRVVAGAEIHKWSHHGILAYLQKQLNEPMLNGLPEGDWHERKDDDRHEDEDSLNKPVPGIEPKHFGALESGPALTDEAFAHFSRFQYPVHAIGYNWTQSNKKSAEAVFTRIKGHL